MNQPSRLYLNSHNGVDMPNETPDNFQINLKQSLHNVSNVELNSFSITFTPYEPNIPAMESRLAFQIWRESNPNNYNLRVDTHVDTTRIYNSPNDLVDELNKVSNATNNKLLFSFEPSLARIVLTCINGTDPVTQIDILTPSGSINRRLGMSNNTTELTMMGSNQVIFPSPPIIIRSQVLYLSTPLLCNDSLNANSSNSSILSMIQLESGAYGSIENFALQNSIFKSDTFTGNIQSVNIQVLDDLYQPIKFCGNTLASCEFALQYDVSEKDNKAKLYL
jgi:hypothetical protein